MCHSCQDIVVHWTKGNYRQNNNKRITALWFCPSKNPNVPYSLRLSLFHRSSFHWFWANQLIQEHVETQNKILFQTPRIQNWNSRFRANPRSLCGQEKKKKELSLTKISLCLFYVHYSSYSNGISFLFHCYWFLDKLQVLNLLMALLLYQNFEFLWGKREWKGL